MDHQSNMPRGFVRGRLVSGSIGLSIDEGRLDRVADSKRSSRWETEIPRQELLSPVYTAKYSNY